MFLFDRLNLFFEQADVIPKLIADPPCNMIAQSQSSTGKTAAMIIAMLNRVDVSKNFPQVLCFSPTYELAIHIQSLVAMIAQVADISYQIGMLGVFKS